MTLYFTHEDCLEHLTPRGHPESPSRLSSLNQHLHESGLLDEVEVRHPGEATFETIGKVHSESLIHLLRSSQPKQGLVRIDADTSFSPRSLPAVRRCVGAVCEAVDAVFAGTHSKAFCGVRPPGHHAERNAAMGFCIFNSIAVGAAFALESVDRVAILDFDAHHGNGTVETFQDDPRVLVCSTYQYPFYPYRYQNVDRGNIVNVPMSEGTKGDTFRQSVEDHWVPAIEHHRPELLFISAGFDAHQDDPLTGLRLADADFKWISRNIVDWSNDFCHGRVVSALEGGYDLDALRRCGALHLESLLV